MQILHITLSLSKLTVEIIFTKLVNKLVLFLVYAVQVTSFVDVLVLFLLAYFLYF